MLKPNKTNIKLWLDALVSGEFEQGLQYLRTSDNKYCCLGVACVVAARNGADERIGQVTPGFQTMPEYALDEWLGVEIREFALPIASEDIADAQAEYLEVTPDDADINKPLSDWPIGSHGHNAISFTGANDNLRWPFRKIAEKVAARLGIEITYPEVANAE